MSWLKVTDDLPIDVDVGQVLVFDKVVLKIMRKTNGEVWAKRLDRDKFLTPEEADATVTVIPKLKT